MKLDSKSLVLVCISFLYTRTYINELSTYQISSDKIIFNNSFFY